MKNILKKIVYYFFILLAVLGFLLIYLSLGGNKYYRPINNYSFYIIIIGFSMALPLLIHLFINGKFKNKNARENNIKVYLSIKDKDKVNFEKTNSKNEFNVFIYNSTKKKVTSNKIIIEANSSNIIQLKKDEIIKLSNGIEFYIEKYENLAVIDKKSQLKGIGNEFIDEYKISSDIDFAFEIDYPFLGDLNYELEVYD